MAGLDSRIAARYQVSIAMIFGRRHSQSGQANGCIAFVSATAVFLCCALDHPAGGGTASRPASMPSTQSLCPSDVEIRQTVRLLNHPSPARRREAVRRLAGWGPVTFPELRRVAAGDKHETALAARELLEELEPAILFGAQVRLEASRTRTRWDEPFDLIVHVRNTTDTEMRVPWPAPTTQPAERDALQVAAMMDAADFLEVSDAKGDVIDLRVDPIEQDEDVYTAVNARAGPAPPSHVIPAGETAHLVIPSLNRGWARYPLFDTQTYTIRFQYQPQWKDRSWIQEGLGQVTAEPVQVRITHAAPRNIRDARTSATLHLCQDGDRLEVRIENNWDRAQGVNTNLGADLERYAMLEWRWDQGLFSEKHRLDFSSADETPEFDPRRVHLLQPGETMTLHRVSWPELRRRVEKSLPLNVSTYGLSARYVNVPTAQALRRLVGDDLAGGGDDRVPAPVLTGAVESNSVRMARGTDTQPE